MPGRQALAPLLLAACLCAIAHARDVEKSRRRVLSADKDAHQPYAADMLVVMPSTAARTAVVKATQRARRGVRTFVVTDTGAALDGNGIARRQIQLRIGSRPQVFGAFKGANLSQPASRLQELRIAMAPFLANRTLGASRFKWILFGHDDTLWLVSGALRLLAGLDPEQPHLLTDSLWFRNATSGQLTQPNTGAPACLPCGDRGKAALGLEKVGGRWQCLVGGAAPVMGCPCTREALAGSEAWQQLLDPATLDFREPSQRAAFRLHIGGGMILSRGLFKRTTYEAVQAWAAAHANATADELLTGIMWDLLGIAPTRPGTDFCRPGQTVFDPGWAPTRQRLAQDPGLDGGNDPGGVLQRLRQCSEGECRDKATSARLGSMVSLHVRQRFASQDLPGELAGMNDEPPRFNATVTLLTQLTEQAHALEKRRWAEEQLFKAAEN